MPITKLLDINYRFPLNNPWGDYSWQMNFTHMYEHTCNGK